MILYLHASLPRMREEIDKPQTSFPKKFSTFATFCNYYFKMNPCQANVRIIYLKESFYCKKFGKEMQKRKWVPALSLYSHMHIPFSNVTPDIALSKKYLSRSSLKVSKKDLIIQLQPFVQL